MANGNVTLEEIAREAGVSKQTVANVLNRANKETWGSTVRRASHIREVAKRLGYQPNGAAKAVRTGRFGAIALLLSTKDDASNLPRRVWQGISDDLQAYDSHLVIFRLPDDKMTDPDLMPKILRERMADGMIIDYTHAIPPDLIDIIENNSLPAVWINTDRQTDCVMPDDFNAAMQATNHLVSVGHTRIAYVNLYARSSTLSHYSANERMEGYCQAMASHGLAPVAVVSSQRSRRETMNELLRMASRPTAVLCYGSLDVQVVMVAAAGLSIDIPADLSIITFGPLDLHVADHDITTMVVPEYEVGLRASEMLRRKIERPEEFLARQRLLFRFAEGRTCSSALREK